MQHLFLSKELAQLAKEKGFNEKCLRYWVNDKLIIDLTPHIRPESKLGAPTYQQIIDWFRESRNLYIEARPLNTLDYWDGYIWNDKMERLFRESGYRTYYEALTKAVEEALLNH